MPVESNQPMPRFEVCSLGGRAGRGKAKRRGNAAYYRRIGLKGLRKRWRKKK